jgi:uncharacterized protein YcbX
MIGETVDRVELTVNGIAGDRTWACRDLERGGIRGAKRFATLMQLAAHRDAGGGITITLPGGTTTSTSDPDVHDRVSDAIGHPVRLEPLRPADDLEHYRRGAPDEGDPVAAARTVLGLEEGDPFPDFSFLPRELAGFAVPPGTYHDAFPLLVMTSASLRALAAALPDSVVDVRRFRPSIVVDTEGTHDAAHPELGWRGRRARVGGAEIEFVGGCPRCVMISRRIDDATPEDRGLMRHVVQHLDQLVGQYARIVSPGPVVVGDEITLLD